MRVRLVPVGTVDRVAGLACLGAWAAALVILGHHFFEITNYRVLTDIGDAPEVFRKRPHLVAVAAVLALMGIAALWGSRCSWTRVAWPAGLASLSLVRYMVTGRVGLADAIGFVLYSGLTAARLLAARPHSVRPAAPSAPIPLALLGLLALANTLYFYHIQQNYFEAFQLGYGDIGSYCRRVHNTAVGLGFLRENPGAPAFYDHFNPALALLVPVYWLFPDIRCLMLVQSVCLSLLAVQLYHTIRPRGGHALALLWAAIACLYPPLTQLHYSYSYGFHPITL
ncbi:MAG: DUF2079 domain-containing protein, partial [Planctomycetes bacterium]|nr:DUF2079 domain-containing protein [Planctomycetota bacterium]